jgi:hypothetical protein
VAAEYVVHTRCNLVLMEGLGDDKRGAGVKSHVWSAALSINNCVEGFGKAKLTLCISIIYSINWAQ